MVINPQFDWVGSFNSGLAPVALGDSEENLKIGFVDIKGNYIVNPMYEYFNFWDNEDNWGNYAKEGFSGGLARFKNQGKIGFLNSDGKIELEPQFEYAGNFVGDISRFSLNEKFGFINKKGQIVVNPKYDSAYNYYDGLAAIKVGELWGFVS
jgi:hypothetical protein